MTPERRAELRREYELGHYMPREWFGELLDSESTVGGWRPVVMDVAGTGVQLWAQEDLSEQWLADHATEFTRLARHVVASGTGLLAVVHDKVFVNFSTLRPARGSTP